MTPAREAYTLVYDGECRVCGRLVNVVRRWDRKGAIEIVGYQTAGVMARFPWISPDAFSEAIQLIGPGHQTWQGAAAVEQLIGVLPRGKLVAWTYSVPFVRAIADRFYRWFARNRYRLGCGTHCKR